TTIVCLLRSNNQIGEVEVKSFRAREIVHEELGALKLTGKELEKIPTLFGEKDIVKALQLMPGIKMGKEGSSGLYVRGGTPGQNLILLDGIPVYNVNHLFGLFSVFTPEAVKSVAVYKGAFPAQYSGRISSVIDVKMREGNLYTIKTDLSLGTISSKALVEMPIVKGKSSILVAGRRSYLDLFLFPFLKSSSYDKTTSETFGYAFYDFNVKLFWDLNQFGKIYWSNYFGQDNLSAKVDGNYIEYDDFGRSAGSIETTKYSYRWGNKTSSLRWNKILGKKLFVNTTLLYAQYHFNLDLDAHVMEIKRDTLISDAGFQRLSQVEDLGLYADFDYFLSTSNQLKFGIHYTSHVFIPNNLSLDFATSKGETFHTTQGSLVNASEMNVYAEDRIQLFKWWEVTLGLQYANYNTEEKSYISLQPRLRSALNFDRWSLKLSGGYMVQPIHNLINTSNLLNVSIWVPSQSNIQPSTSLQFDMGASYLINPSYSFSVEAYWRKMNHILTYKNGESFFNLYDRWYDRVMAGSGEAYGLELMVRKTEGNTSGWMGYTWSVCNQQFEQLNKGKAFPFSFDRRHYLSISVAHRLSNHIQLSGNWILASGEPITISTTGYHGDPYYGKKPLEYDYAAVLSKKVYAPNQLIYFTSVNNYRLPAYHRLDLGIDFTKEKQRGKRTWSFSIYNAYARNNPYMVNFEVDRDGKIVLKNATIFRFLPSVSYRFVFK
ncbi:MAG: TonB-dependent receptor plug domain-containing protein, partial [Prolixibacteraceae bacterium]|nr:TonB-dependent receptor plug domain-containing protein [Prolixibacteraceae bacterium]